MGITEMIRNSKT